MGVPRDRVRIWRSVANTAVGGVGVVVTAMLGAFGLMLLGVIGPPETEGFLTNMPNIQDWMASTLHAFGAATIAVLVLGAIGLGALWMGDRAEARIPNH